VSTGPGNECSKADSSSERMFHGTNGPGNECSLEHSFPRTK